MEETADWISRSVGVLKVMMDTIGRELEVSHPSGIHHAAELKGDILALVKVFKTTQLFQSQPGRQFSAFLDFDRNILSKLKYKDLWQWMRSKFKEFRAQRLS